ncbi:hypothetical protein KSS87_003664 [Heliosperma pusillum]|nr:hypothetical protein KSS87_018602 [Heliosperma pusillum]KAH9613110.1 hypothetical protein KSS87_003664 [Heliosperma pusillum]
MVKMGTFMGRKKEDVCLRHFHVYGGKYSSSSYSG